MSLRRSSSEYSHSQNSGSQKKKEVSNEAKKAARGFLYKVCFKDWMALIGIIPSAIAGALPILFVYLSTDIIDAIMYAGTVTAIQAIISNPLTPPEQIEYLASIYDLNYSPMPDIENCMKKMAAVGAAQGVCQFFNSLIWLLVGNNVKDTLKTMMYSNLMQSEISYFDITPIGNILTLMSEDSEAVSVSFGSTKSGQFKSIVQAIIGLVLAFVNCWQVAFVSICFIPVVAICLLCIIPFLLKFSAQKFKYVSESMTIAEETLSSIRTVRGFNREAIEEERFMKATKEACKRDRYIGYLISIFMFVVLVSLSADIMGDLYYGATFVDIENQSGPPKGKITMGELMTLFMYTMMGAMGVVGIQGTLQGEEKAVAAGARILEVANHISSIPFDGGDTIENFKGEIEFQNVSFKYPTRDAYVLKNVSFTIKPMQIGALVGHSGSGKSTCVQLLERFYDANEGLVLLDGHDIKTLDQHWLHQKLALVSQEPILFRKTLRENIRYGCHNATDEEILEAVEIANAKRVLEKLEHGLDTLVGEKGSSLSGGQRQRIAIARAIIKKPVILITDEATSALDAQSEKKVQIALDKVMKDCTSVIVAHRLSTIRNANVIYVFDAGEIKESGTHDELIAKGGYYYNLVFRQLTDKDTQMRNEAAKESDQSAENDEESSTKHDTIPEVDKKDKKVPKRDKSNESFEEEDLSDV